MVSGNIYPAIAVHTLFDLGGFLWHYGFATGKLWTAENVIFTAVVAVLSAVVMIIAFVKSDFSEVYERWGLDVYPEKTGE